LVGQLISCVVRFMRSTLYRILSFCVPYTLLEWLHYLVLLYIGLSVVVAQSLLSTTLAYHILHSAHPAGLQ